MTGHVALNVALFKDQVKENGADRIDVLWKTRSVFTEISPKKSTFGRKDIFQPLPSSILLNNTYPRVFSGYLAHSRTQPALTVLPNFYSSLKAPCVI